MCCTDTFTTFNDEPFEVGLPIAFTGDGETRKFDLGRAHTFGHVVSVDGVEQSGSLYTGGYGGTFPSGADYLVIKQMVSDAGCLRFVISCTSETHRKLGQLYLAASILASPSAICGGLLETWIMD